MSGNEITDKVLRYESFLNDKLKEDLKIIEKRLEEVNSKLTSWYLLKKSLSDINEHHPRGFKTKTDIGCGLLMQVKVNDPSVVKMHVGLDVYLDMTLDDGVKYCDSRIKLLLKECEHLQTQANKVKAHIKVVLLGLQELQNLNICT